MSDGKATTYDNQARFQSEEIYRGLIEQANDGIVVVQDSTVKYANPRMAEIDGSAVEHIVGSPITDHIEAGDLERVTEMYRRRMAGENVPPSYCAALKRRDGSPVYADINLIDITFRGRPAVLAVVRDATEQKRMERELRASEEKYRLIADTAYEGIVIASPEGAYTYVNQRMADMLGYPVDEVIGKFSKDFIFDGWLPVVHQIRTGLREGRFSQGEFKYRRKDGSALWTAYNATAVFDNEGRHVANIGMHTDITERKRAEDSEKRLLALMDYNPSLIFLKDRQGRYIYLNKTYEQQFVHSIDWRGKTDFDLWEKESAELFRTNDAEVLRSGRLMQFLEDSKDMCGERHCWLCYKFPFTDANGEQCVGGIGIDATERVIAQEQLREHEMELRRSRDELELRVQERTQELTDSYEKLQKEIRVRESIEEKLIQSQKMEAIGTLAGGIAHDFNNILAAILGLADISLDEVEPGSRLEKNLRNILNSSYRARDLIKQMLAFSRKTEYEVKPLRIAPLVKEMSKLLRASIPATIKIVVKDMAASDTILANTTAMQQVIMNLATNAAHAMREKGGTLTIIIADAEPEPHPALAPGPYLQLSVHDTGTGMDADLIPKIFEPFFTTKEVGQGTGMGLAVVYGIVKSLKGEVAVESVPGEGSVFRVILPKTEPGEMPEALGISGIPRGSERILFVDDEELIVELGKDMLGALGYVITAVTGSTEALALFYEDPSQFDLVIADQTMPELTGMNLASEFLKLRPGLPVILCTGHSDSVDEESARAAGIRDYLMKPLSKRELAEAVRRALDNKNEM